MILQKDLLENDALLDILGQDEAKKQLKSALLAQRHLIIAGPPGIGKTTMARSIAKLLPEVTVNSCGYNCDPSNPVCPKCRSGEQTKKSKIAGDDRFVRIQGSPDLTSEDLLGDIDPLKALKFGPTSIEAFSPGKIFRSNNGILFFDEINRCPAKLQNALLQVLEERKATIGSYSIDIDANFIFIGTMNPRDSTTEQLSEVFLDRCDVVYMTHPETLELEKQILETKGKKMAEFSNELLDKTINFVRRLRHSIKLEKVPSVRASLGLYERAQANAVLRNSEIVEELDVKDAIVSVLAHRIELKPSVKYTQTTKQFLEEETNEFGAASGGYR